MKTNVGFNKCSFDRAVFEVVDHGKLEDLITLFFETRGIKAEKLPDFDSHVLLQGWAFSPGKKQ